MRRRRCLEAKRLGLVTPVQPTAFELLEQLPPRQRTAVVLRYYEDLSYEQIAKTMDVSVGTAKAQVSVGLQRLRTLLEERARKST